MKYFRSEEGNSKQAHKVFEAPGKSFHRTCSSMVAMRAGRRPRRWKRSLSESEKAVPLFTKGFDSTAGPKSRTNVGRSCKANKPPKYRHSGDARRSTTVNTNNFHGETGQRVNLALVTLEGGEEAADPTHKAIIRDENEADS